MMFWYYYARPNSMVGHRFTDDVAITKAWTKRGAIRNFSKYYLEVKASEVERISRRKCSHDVWILTDY